MFNLQSSKGFYEILLGLGIVAIVALALLPNVQDEIDKSTFIFNSTDAITNLTALNNSAYTVAKSSTENGFGKIQSVTRLGNNTFTYTSGNYSISADSTITIRMIAGFQNKNGTSFANQTSANITYTWTTDQYIADSSSRSILPLIVLFIALSLLIMFVGAIKF